MLVTVQLHDCVEALAQSVAVGGETDDGEEEGRVGLGGVGAANFEDFGDVAGVDAVAGGGAGVAGEDGKGVAGDGEGGTAVVGVSVVYLAYNSKYRDGDEEGIRVEAVTLLWFAVVGWSCGCAIRVVWPVHERVLAEHSHLGCYFVGYSCGEVCFNDISSS